jgi:hypothetical protein
MVAEFLIPKEIAIKQTEREEFRLRRDPPANWHIWIAFYIGTKWQMGGIFHNGIGLYLPPRPVRIGVKNTQYTVIGLGRLLAISLSSEEDRLTFGVNNKLKAAGGQLWPTTPPQGGIDDIGARTIVGALGKLFGFSVPDLA